MVKRMLLSLVDLYPLSEGNSYGGNSRFRHLQSYSIIKGGGSSAMAIKGAAFALTLLLLGVFVTCIVRLFCRKPSLEISSKSSSSSALSSLDSEYARQPLMAEPVTPEGGIVGVYAPPVAGKVQTNA